MQKWRLILKPPTCKHVQIPAIEILERRQSEPLDVEKEATITIATN
jgi:hypothetical protein